MSYTQNSSSFTDENLDSESPKLLKLTTPHTRLSQETTTTCATAEDQNDSVIDNSDSESDCDDSDDDKEASSYTE